MESPLNFFFDPILRAPTLGSMLMCLTASLVGVIVFLRKRSLLGESLSHASYPGVILGVVIAGYIGLSDQNEAVLSLLVLIGGFFSALLGLYSINFLENNLKIKADSALCVILSTFFGVGITLASFVQFNYTNLYRQVQSYLYGQAATMTDINVIIYGILTIFVIVTILLFLKEIQVLTFDRIFSKTIGIPIVVIDMIFFILIVLAVIIGIRSVGVVLMSAMFIAPASAARQYTNSFSKMFIIAGFFGLLCGFLGNYLSVEISQYLAHIYPNERVSIPTGPLIVLIASLVCFWSLLFAPRQGLLFRIVRIAKFKLQTLEENVLKTLWRRGEPLTLKDIQAYQNGNIFTMWWILNLLQKRKFIAKSSHTYYLTDIGKIVAAKIVRLHRLWEVYLANYLEIGVEKVHKSAEEMEHVLTPELEKELTSFLQDPVLDPHHQPIPAK